MTQPHRTAVRYRKKPVEVDTVQWTGGNIDELIDFTGGNFLLVDEGERLDPEITAKVYDELHTTWVLVKTGQHVVRGVKGEFYPIAEDVLAETYERADAEPAPQSPADRADLRDRIAAMRDLLRGMALSLATGSGPLVEPSAFDAALDDYRDAVLAVLPEPADRAVVRAETLREAADRLWALANRTTERGAGVLWAAEWLRRLAGEQPAPECAASISGNCLAEAQSEGPCDTDDGECVHGGRPGAEQPAQDEAVREWCKCSSCWGWFVEEHPGEDLDELGKDLRWWSGLPEHRDPPASARPTPPTT